MSPEVKQQEEQIFIMNENKTKIEEFKNKYSNENKVPRPPYWSGWRVMPEEIEFWLDGENRIHERLNYKSKDGKWIKEILYP